MAPAADLTAGSWGVNGIMMEELGEIFSVWGGGGMAHTPLGTLGGQMRSPLLPRSPAALLGTAPAIRAAGCKWQLAGGATGVN